jgi:hypothetical protein
LKETPAPSARAARAVIWRISDTMPSEDFAMAIRAAWLDEGPARAALPSAVSPWLDMDVVPPGKISEKRRSS